MTTALQPNIPLKTYRFFFDFDLPLKLPKFAGSAWRGAFGTALKKTVCVVRNTPCNECMLKSSCAYSYVFETPPPDNTEKMRKYNAAPHPFVLRLVDGKNQSKSQYALDLTLFGHAGRFFPYLVYALQRAGLEGIGGHRQIFSLKTIVDMSDADNRNIIYEDGKLTQNTCAASPEIPAMPAHITINLLTPLRVKQGGKNVSHTHFSFGAFFSTLLRRISMISYFHTDTPLETDFAALTAQAKNTEFSTQQLSWYDWTRYSSRQDTEMNMGGLVGKLQLDMQGLEKFWPYLWLGQWTHLGKGTSMGLGAYSIQMTSLSNDTIVV
jgi:hypothetical protein